MTAYMKMPGFKTTQIISLSSRGDIKSKIKLTESDGDLAACSGREECYGLTWQKRAGTSCPVTHEVCFMRGKKKH